MKLIRNLIQICLLLLTSQAAEAQFTYNFTYATNNGTITIAGYTGSAYPGPYYVYPPLNIPSEIGNLPVTSIGTNSFSDCFNLGNLSIIIPTGVTNIGANAFAGANLYDSSVAIPNTVTSIGANAFGANAFAGSSLNSVNIPNGVISIGAGAFTGTTLTSVTIPQSVTDIGGGPFADSQKLTAISVDPSNPVYVSIDGVLFNQSLTTLIQYPGGRGGAYTIPSGVISIGCNAFYGAETLTAVTIPNSVTSIGSNAFLNCFHLDSITIPNSVTNIGYGAFASPITGLYNVSIGNGVISIGDYAFADCQNLTSLTIPNGVTYIGNFTFQECASLNNITIGTNVASIGEDAFLDCNSLGSVKIPGSVTNIGEQAFFGDYFITAINVDTNNREYSSVGGILFNKSRTTLIQCPPYLGGGATSYVIPNGVTNIASYAFAYCGVLNNITIPSSVTSIGDGAFQNCLGLTSITIPSSVTNIGEGAFASCSALPAITVATNNPAYTNVNGVLFDKSQTTLIQYPVGNVRTFYPIPRGVSKIGAYAFVNAYAAPGSATSVTIPTSVTNIGDYAFEGAFVTNVTIPNSVTSIGANAFADCALTSVTIPNSVTSIGDYAFQRSVSITNFAFGNGVTNIGNYAFYQCRLPNITIGNSVTSIGDYAFNSCETLSSVTIPQSVTKIGQFAFYTGGGALYSAYFLGDNPSINWDTFWADVFVTVYYLSGTSGWGSTYTGPPAAELTAIAITATPTNGMAPLMVNFTSTNMDSSGNVVNNWNWNFGDGTTSTAQNPSHTYTNTGTFSVSLIETNSQAVPLAGSGMTIAVPPPAVAISASPTNGVVPLSVGFTSAGVDTVGNTVKSRIWYFGDGSTSTNQNPSHVYTNAGTFVPTIVATESLGITASGSGPTITPSFPNDQYNANPTLGLVPFTVQFTALRTDSGGNTMSSWNWAFGDGSTSTSQNPSHAYTTTGAFFPTLIGTNNIGVMVTGSGPALIIGSILVFNGGFETGDFTDWTMSGDTSYAFVDNGSISGITPYSGNYEAALGTSGSRGYLSQTLATIAGARYSLSFRLDGPAPQTSSEFLASWNGNTLYDETNIPPVGWTNLQFFVYATGTNTVLQFGFRDDTSYLGLDNISGVMASLPAFAGIGLAGTNLVLNGINGQADATYYVLTSTNLILPLIQWTPVATNTLSTSGNFTITVTNTGIARTQNRFYLLKLQ